MCICIPFALRTSNATHTPSCSCSRAHNTHSPLSLSRFSVSLSLALSYWLAPCLATWSKRRCGSVFLCVHRNRLKVAIHGQNLEEASLAPMQRRFSVVLLADGVLSSESQTICQDSDHVCKVAHVADPAPNQATFGLQTITIAATNLLARPFLPAPWVGRRRRPRLRFFSSLTFRLQQSTRICGRLIS